MQHFIPNLFIGQRVKNTMNVFISIFVKIMIPKNPITALHICNISVSITPNLMNTTYVSTLVPFFNLKYGVSIAVNLTHQGDCSPRTYKLEF